MAGEVWTIKKFGDCAALVRDTVSPADAKGSPYIGLEHIGEGTLWLIGQGTTDDVASVKSRFRKGDILFGKLRPYFRKVIIAPFDGVCSTDIWVVRPRTGIDAGFLFYWMASRAFVDESMRGSEGTKMPRARWEFVSRIERRVPSEPYQRAIACILGALDHKIELNRRMNQTLEAMARAIFKSWFVDFDPVRAKSEGRDPGLPPNIAALLPDEFDESDLGEIPRGWPASTVGQHFRLTMGQSPPGTTYNETAEGLPFYQGRTDFGFRFPSRRVFCTAPTRLAEPGDTLVSVRAPVGDVNMASERCAVGRGVAAIRHRSGSRSFTYYSMHQLGDHFGKFEAEGTVFGCINKSDFERLPFVAPPPEILRAFEQVVSPLDDRIETGERQTSTLAGLRDALLPKLISGELPVQEAERIVGRCV